LDQRLHDGRTMRRPLSFWLGLVGSCWLPAFALAQSSTTTTTPVTATGTGGLGVALLTVGEEAYNAQRRTPLGKTACDANVNLHFRVTNLNVGSGSPKYMEIYKGTACNTTEAKDGVGDDDCVRIKYEDRNQSSMVQEFDIPISELCSNEGDVTLWFLPVDTLDTNEAVTPYGVFELPLDVIPPDAPSNVKGGVGETEIPITWDRNDANISRNWILWDPNPVSDSGGDADGGTDGTGTTDTCGSPDLIPGQAIDLDHLPRGIGRKEAVGDIVSSKLSGDQIGSTRAAVAVVAQDLAGNWSVLSNVACVDVVPTNGFWDAYKADGGEAAQGCACSLSGSPTSSARPPARGLFAALGVLALAAVRRRRKRHS
jgi:MYXO-CTERM domain-containing protein